MAYGADVLLLPHGIQGRADLPVPDSMFLIGSAVALVASFVLMGFGWKKSRFSNTPLLHISAPSAADKLASSAKTIGQLMAVLSLLLTMLIGWFGSTEASNNAAPTIVFVIFWVGLVPLSVLFGDVWRSVNPWATIATWSGAQERTARDTAWFGHFPALVTLAVFTWIELVTSIPSSPQAVATIISFYTVITVAAMHVFGVEAWLDQGEGFTVYSSLLARLSPWINYKSISPPLVRTTELHPLKWTVPLITLLIGSVSFDGLSRSQWWVVHFADATNRLVDAGLSLPVSQLVVKGIGFVLVFAGCTAIFYVASMLAERLGMRAESGLTCAGSQVHSLIPIAAVYAVAHYFSYFWFQSQTIIGFASDPLGNGSNYLGTADFSIDYSTLSANAIWLVQVCSIVIGHILGLALAHDKALALTNTHRRALLTQVPMLVAMVIYTVCGMWFLSEGM